jgi:5-methylcytosine-specific restriction endonuclease McrA
MPSAIYTPLKRDETGHALCRWCSKPVPRGRRTFCGPPCVDEWGIRTDPGYARRIVEDRDHGICALCGLDTERIKRIAERLGKLAKGYRDWNEDPAPWVMFPSSTRRLAQLDILCWLVSLYMGQVVFENTFHVTESGANIPRLRHHLWEADHIVPVVEGGGECGIDNLRTVCLHCHKAATRALAAKRSLMKKRQLAPFGVKT